ncbi:non-hydrolyzing UDP-N-acetylglucosamine 2-epimerase [uncultured Polaribacter sp.]|uniref:non-hydrolyzing UDP-N-acetylglucosamine 2-epimerase n=1 Tax=uncultured Polaribacter sp. TaxID=174711 RepID=UPI00262A58BA|nr:UDP-N-acetylglucosamine 2-epimerase (non-hydrolyzing) [uncultured Polaribacter sp.]
MKITFIIGTRPELIKVAPVILELKKHNVDFDIVNTAQHKDLLDPYWDTFEIEPTLVLDVMVAGQSLSSLTERAINAIQSYIDTVEVKPTIILAQGDTTTVMAASLVSFYNKIKFAHLEAGLRSFDFDNPFPEEMNRRIASIAAEMHFCPTEVSKTNLLNEGIDANKIFVIGNTVVDSLNLVVNNDSFKNLKWLNSDLDKTKNFSKKVLITCHRRENHGDNLSDIIEAVNELAMSNKDTVYVWTLHPNPNVRGKVLDSKLSKLDNVILIKPLEYLDLLKMLNISFCAISDSGGIQEEAPSFNTPVLVLRETTERPEGVTEGVAFLVGSDCEKIVKEYNNLKTNPPVFTKNPYGDGLSSSKIIRCLINQ